MERLKASEVKAGKGGFLYVEGIGKVAVFNAGGAFFATQDRCPGDGKPLSDAAVAGSMIECACDKARFYLPTGEGFWPPGIGALRTYRVWIDGDEILFDLDKHLEREAEALKGAA